MPKRKHQEGESKNRKRAKWSEEKTKMLIDLLNKGEDASEACKLFTEFTKQQVHNKISSLRSAGKIKPRTQGLAPSLQPGTTFSSILPL